MVELKALGSTLRGLAVSPDTIEMNSGPACSSAVYTSERLCLKDVS